MSITRTVTFLTLLLTAGCTGAERTAPHAPPPAAAVSSGIVATEPAADSATRLETAKADAPTPKPVKKVAPSPAPASPQGRKGNVTTSTSKPTAAAPPLDLPLLEKRLRETGAIGVFTKIALKNQVDDLLNKFRAYYQGRSHITLAELRQPYDMLLLKVLSLLQDSDPNLAHAIVASRETIWGMLTDPNKFATL